MGHSRPLFLYFHLFYKQLTVNKCSIKVVDDWIRTRVLWYQKLPLCQLRHNHCSVQLLLTPENPSLNAINFYQYCNTMLEKMMPGLTLKRPTITYVPELFSFRSASSKSKYAIDWYFSGKKDELSNCKSTLKLAEDSEPIALLVDPKDSKSIFALCLNRFRFTSENGLVTDAW